VCVGHYLGVPLIAVSAYHESWKFVTVYLSIVNQMTLASSCLLSVEGGLLVKNFESIV
jgi:hypothetical protein